MVLRLDGVVGLPCWCLLGSNTGVVDGGVLWVVFVPGIAIVPISRGGRDGVSCGGWVDP